MALFFFWLLFSIGVGVLASKRGRNAVYWTFLAMVASPLIAVIVLFLIPDLEAQQMDYLRTKQDFSNRVQKEKLKEQELVSESKKINSTDYSASFEKLNSLFINKILTADEFSSRKANHIADLKNKTITEEPDLFLGDLINIYKSKIITDGELQQIKSILYRN